MRIYSRSYLAGQRWMVDLEPFDQRALRRFFAVAFPFNLILGNRRLGNDLVQRMQGACGIPQASRLH